MAQVNRLVDLVPPAELGANGLDVGHVEALVLAPSQDLGLLALAHADSLPGTVRALLRGLGSTQGTGANLVSYLLFDRAFCRALLALGYGTRSRGAARSSRSWQGSGLVPPRFAGAV